MKRFVSFLAICSMFFISNVTMAATPPQHQQFIKSVLAYANNANQNIIEQRQHFDKIEKSYQKHHQLSSQDQQWLTQLAKQYKVTGDIHQAKTWQTLKKRVDIIPPSLIIAQAANESAWGTSRFAKQGNNYFGQWCYTPGCGIVPLRRSPGRTHEVKKFATPEASITAYMKNLNTNHAYVKLRDLRYQQRQTQQQIDGLNLANGLAHYSERGQGYVNSIQHIIKKYQLSQYDVS